MGLAMDSLSINADSLAQSLKADSRGTVIDTVPGSGVTVRISPDAIDQQIDYYSRDTSWFEAQNNRLHLYGDAKITYGDRSLQAGYIIFDMDRDEATAYKTKATDTQPAEEVIYSDNSQKVRANELRFNFETKKGLIRQAITKEGEFNIIGATTKFVSGDSDSLIQKDRIYNRNAIITTCTNDRPHFGIRAYKLKVIPDEVAVAGLSNLEIADIPTPAFLPFGFFPLIKGRSSGLIFPRLWTYERQYGLGLQGIGYYFPINDYMDARLTADFFLRGTHRLHLTTKYKKRYAYTGTFRFDYANEVTDVENTTETSSRKSYKIYLDHRQDPKAHPYQTIGGNIDLQFNSYDRRNLRDFNSQFNNVITSNFNYTNQLPGTPFRLVVGLGHRQNSQSRQMTIDFPKATLTSSSMFPFKKKNSSDPTWYENISVQYTAVANARASGADSTFFSQETMDNIQSGVRHTANMRTTGKILKYFNINPSVNYEENWYFRVLDRSFDDSIMRDTISVDTTLEGALVYRVDSAYVGQVDDYQTAFKTFRTFRASLGVGTQVFGTRQFASGWLRGLRHVMKPSISFNYSPNTRKRYERVFAARDASGQLFDDTYNPFAGTLYSVSLKEEELGLTWSLVNIFEMKYHSKKDSTDKIFKILRNLTFTGGYNWAKDSLKLQNLTFRGNTNIIKSITNLNISGNFDAYHRDANNRQINKSVWSTKRIPYQFNHVEATLSSTVTGAQIVKWFSKKNADEDPKPNTSNLPKLSDLIQNIRFQHTYRIAYSRMHNVGRDTLTTAAHSLRMSGSVPLSKNWDMRVDNISYDIKNKSFVYPSLTFSRDLHCWEMNFSWIPRSETYSFYIGVKSNSLAFIKYNYGANSFGGR